MIIFTDMFLFMLKFISFFGIPKPSLEPSELLSNLDHSTSNVLDPQKTLKFPWNTGLKGDELPTLGNFGTGHQH